MNAGNGAFHQSSNLNNPGETKIHTVILYNIPMSIGVIAKHGLGHDSRNNGKPLPHLEED